jgi:hypothetical protein
MAALRTRQDYPPSDLRQCAAREREPRAIPRLLAIANALEGMTRAETARGHGAQALHVPETITHLPLQPASPRSTRWSGSGSTNVSTIPRIACSVTTGCPGGGLPCLEPAPQRGRRSHNIDGPPISHFVSDSLTG